MRDTNAPDPIGEYRPSGHMLMLLLRAAVADASDAGPWLTLQRSAADEPRVYVHHISLTATEMWSAHRLVMCSGAEALGFAFHHRWPSITAPTRAELRALGDWCVERVNAPQWDRGDRDAWIREYMGPRAKQRRDFEADMGAAHTRALRWELAEQWLRQ